MDARSTVTVVSHHAVTCIKDSPEHAESFPAPARLTCLHWGGGSEKDGGGGIGIIRHKPGWGNVARVVRKLSGNKLIRVVKLLMCPSFG